MKEFAGKVAVVTGAGSGFGREFARIGASLGMKLVTCSGLRATDACLNCRAGAWRDNSIVVVASGQDKEVEGKKLYVTFALNKTQREKEKRKEQTNFKNSKKTITLKISSSKAKKL